MITNKISTTTYINIPKIIKKTIKKIKYTKTKYNYNYKTITILTTINKQSPNITQNINKTLKYHNKNNKKKIKTTNTNNQNLIFNYTTNKTKTYIPLTIYLSHQLTKHLSNIHKNNTLNYLQPNNKIQITIKYNKNNNPIHINTIIISTQHTKNITLKQIQKNIKTHIIYPTIPKNLINKQTKFYINPTKHFIINKPQNNTKLTKHKIIINTYNNYTHHNNKYFNNKDPTKINHSTTYTTHYITKNIITTNLTDQYKIQLTYTINITKPISITINTFKTNKISKKQLIKTIKKHFNLKPTNIIKILNLKQPIYKQTTTYNHFKHTNILFP